MSSQEASRSRPSGDVCEQELYAFIGIHFQDELMTILKDPEEFYHFPIPITYIQLTELCPQSAQELLRCPDKVLSSGDKAAFRALQVLYEECGSREELKLKRHVHLRIHSMPCEGFDRYMTVFPGCDEIGIFMTIVGTVVKIQRTGMVEFKREYRCNKCKHITTQFAPISRYYTLPRSIDQCENLCVGAKVDALDAGVDGITAKDASRFKDYQEIKLQEQIKNNDSSSMPKAMWVILEDDLVDSCKPGDDVVMTGTLFCRFKPFRVNQPIEADLAFKANHV